MSTDEFENNEKPSETPAQEQPAGIDDLANVFRIQRKGGETRIQIRPFAALDGWDIKRQYREFLESKDPKERMSFTIIVLSYATAQGVVPDVEMPIFKLNSYAAINDQLENWQNVETVFKAVLEFNGINTDPAEAERMRWQVAGEDMAASFLAAVSEMVGPALKLYGNKKASE